MGYTIVWGFYSPYNIDDPDENVLLNFVVAEEHIADEICEATGFEKRVVHSYDSLSELNTDINFIYTVTQIFFNDGTVKWECKFNYIESNINTRFDICLIQNSDYSNEIQRARKRVFLVSAYGYNDAKNKVRALYGFNQ
jgi:hypothetical protein